MSCGHSDKRLTAARPAAMLVAALVALVSLSRSLARSHTLVLLQHLLRSSLYLSKAAPHLGQWDEQADVGAAGRCVIVSLSAEHGSKAPTEVHTGRARGARVEIVRAPWHAAREQLKAAASRWRPLRCQHACQPSSRLVLHGCCASRHDCANVYSAMRHHTQRAHPREARGVGQRGWERHCDMAAVSMGRRTGFGLAPRCWTSAAAARTHGANWRAGQSGCQ